MKRIDVFLAKAPKVCYTITVCRRRTAFFTAGIYETKALEVTIYVKKSQS